jgi:hypothetical protein
MINEKVHEKLRGVAVWYVPIQEPLPDTIAFGGAWPALFFLDYFFVLDIESERMIPHH